nr:glycoside hydrolase domain-containing protein [Streptacidiphilus jiangxiensis]
MASVTGGTTTAPRAATTATSTATVPAPRVFTGRAFDACTAPSLTTMKAWRKASPYGAAAVYIGGKSRGCAQPNLTASWVTQVAAVGWQLIPLYVGAQPPCQTSANPERISAANASSLGAADGADAARKAAALGMRKGSAIYLDMEAYDTANAACVQSVLIYTQAWDRAAHSAGYLAGFYGFSRSSADAVAKAKVRGVASMPDAFWYARYDGYANTTTGFPWPTTLWTGHRRAHQYAVNLRETYGGVTLTLDHDAWDAPVAVIG